MDIGNYVVLGFLCTLIKLIWEAIAGDTSLITPPPPPPSGFKPGVQTSNPACSRDKPWCHVMDQNHNISDCITFRCYNNTNINWMARRAFLSLSSKINSNRPNQWWEITHKGGPTQLITHLYCKTTRHLNDIQGRARRTRDQLMTRYSLANRSDHFLSPSIIIGGKIYHAL